MDQHYVPQFYLRQWVGPNGKLWRYRLEPNGKVSETAVVPRGTAFKPDLYRLSDDGSMVPGAATQTIETDVLSPLDSKASIILGKMVGGGGGLSDREQDDWARFLASLLLRHEGDVDERDARAPHFAAGVRLRMLEGCPDDHARARLTELLDGLDLVAMAKDAHRGVMVRTILSEDATAAFHRLKWDVIDVPDGRLITSDRPLLVNLGRDRDSLQLLSMPLSPTRLFIGYPRDWTMNDPEVRRLFTTIMTFHDLFCLAAAPRCVYSREKLEDRPGLRLRTAVHDVLGGSNEPGAKVGG